MSCSAGVFGLPTEEEGGRFLHRYRAGDERTRTPGQRCDCVSLGAAPHKQNEAEVLAGSLNQFATVERRLAARAGVGLLPFFNLTAPRHDMHYAHYCSFAGQQTPGRCCDCTHFCYTPLFWDTVFGALARTLRRELGRRPPRADAVAVPRRRGGLGDAAARVAAPRSRGSAHGLSRGRARGRGTGARGRDAERALERSVRARLVRLASGSASRH